MKRIAIIATLDTKSVEVAFARSLIEKGGHRAVLIDIGVFGEPGIAPDVTREEILRGHGVAWSEVVRCGKGRRIELMTQAVAPFVAMLYAQGRFDAVFAMGGIQNTLMAANAMRALPVGVPKLILSTMASGMRLFGPFVGTKDIAVMHSVADISGINMVTGNVMATAVAAIVGMAENGPGPLGAPAGTIVGVTMLGVTGGGATAAARTVRDAGFETISFHATGVGGAAMEKFIAQGTIGATLDMTLHEITGEVFGGYCSGAVGRLSAAAAAGIPQVVVPGAVDMLSCCADFGTEGFPVDWQTRKKIQHNANLFHVKLNREEIERVAALIATRLNAAAGPVTVLIPARGFCEAGAPGGDLHDPEIDRSFVARLRQELKPRIKFAEVELNICQPEFGELAARELLKYFA